MTDKRWVETLVTETKFPRSRISELVQGNIRDIIIMFKQAVDKAEALGYKNLKISWGHIEGASVYYIKADRLETDAEYGARLYLEQAEEAAERALYEKLKRKFETK